MVSRSTLVLRSRAFLPLLASAGCRSAGDPDLEGKAQVLMHADPSRPAVCRSRGSRGVVFEQSKAFLPQHFEVVKFSSP